MGRGMNILSGQVSINVVQRRVECACYLPIEEGIPYIFDKKFIVLGSCAVLGLSGQRNLPLEDKLARLGKNIFDLSVHSSSDMKIKIQTGESPHDLFFPGVNFFANVCIPFINNRDDPKFTTAFALKEHTLDFRDERQFDAGECLNAEDRLATQNTSMRGLYFYRSLSDKIRESIGSSNVEIC